MIQNHKLTATLVGSDINKAYVDSTFLRESSLGNGFIWNGGMVDVSATGTGSGVTQSYVDASLLKRDSSLNTLTVELNLVESSLGALTTRHNVTETSLGTVITKNTNQDASINSIWTKLGSLDTSVLNNTVKDGNQDTSINGIWTKITSVDSSLTLLGTKNGNQDISINAVWTKLGSVDTSFGLYYTKTQVDASFALKTHIHETVYIKESSLGTKFSWVGGLLDVSVVGGSGVAQTYVDASLTQRDGSITAIIGNLLKTDTSLNTLLVRYNNTETSIGTLFTADKAFATNASVGTALSNCYTKTQIDSSFSLKTHTHDTVYVKEASLGTKLVWVGGILDVSIQAEINGVSQAYVDASLLKRDSSINALSVELNTAESSLGALTTRHNVTETSLGLINVSAYATNASVGLVVTTINASIGNLLTADKTFATNASVGTAIGGFSTNASVNLIVTTINASLGNLFTADRTFATNASVGLVVTTINASIGNLLTADKAFATNASVGTAIGGFATNVSIGLVVTTINASIGLLVTKNSNQDISINELRTYVDSSLNAKASQQLVTDVIYSIGTSIAPFATNASVGLALGPYATNASVNTIIATINASISNSVTLNDALTPDISTSTEILFNKIQGYVYGTPYVPIRGNITANFTGAIVGVTDLIISASTGTPTFPATFKKLAGTYLADASLNYIYVQYIDSSNQVYNINRPS